MSVGGVLAGWLLDAKTRSSFFPDRDDLERIASLVQKCMRERHGDSKSTENEKSWGAGVSMA